jgi:hypothetical protein
MEHSFEDLVAELDQFEHDLQVLQDRIGRFQDRIGRFIDDARQVVRDDTDVRRKGGSVKL